MRLLCLSTMLLLVSGHDSRAEPDLLLSAYEQAGTNAVQLKKAMAKAEHLAGAMEFLILNMPDRDRQSLTADYLLENTSLAFDARKRFPWGSAVPEDVFLNDVLPYATLNEQRDNWRADFYDRFSKVVVDCKTMEEAVVAINTSIKSTVGVKYSTKRKKADQSPYESMESGLASCTGLSILLVDALRSVGIPARIAGTPMWTNKRGNHNWVEVWVDGAWAFTEYDSPNLNKAWFLKDAAAANTSKPFNKIYASSFKAADYWFPLVWDMTIRYVHAVEVSDTYKKQYATRHPAPDAGGVTVSIRLFDKEGGSRVSESISVVNAEGVVVASGKTAGAQDDMNNLLQFTLPQGRYKAVFERGATCRTVAFTVGAKQKQPIDLYVE